MGPLDFLKQKLQQGIGAIGSDIGHAIGTGVQDVSHAFGGGSAPAAPQQTQLRVAPPQTQPQLSVQPIQTQPTIQPPKPLAAGPQLTAPIQPPAPVVSGVKTLADTSAQLTNPMARLSPDAIAQGQNLRTTPSMAADAALRANPSYAIAPQAAKPGPPKSPGEAFTDWLQQSGSQFPLIGPVLNAVGKGVSQLNQTAAQYGGNPAETAARGANVIAQGGVQNSPLGAGARLFGGIAAQATSPNQPIDNPALRYMTGGPAESFSQQIHQMGVAAGVLNIASDIFGAGDALGDASDAAKLGVTKAASAIKGKGEAGFVALPSEAEPTPEPPQGEPNAPNEAPNPLDLIERTPQTAPEATPGVAAADPVVSAAQAVIAPEAGAVPPGIDPETGEIRSTATPQPAQPANVPTDDVRGVVMAETRPNTPGGYYETKELLPDPQTGEIKQYLVQHIGNDRVITAPGEKPQYQGAAAAPDRLSLAERAKIIAAQDNQQTANQIELNPAEGNTRGAIAQATGVADEMKSRLDAADYYGSKLDKHDQLLLSERADKSATIVPHDPDAFNKASSAWDDAFDYSLAARRAGGDPTLRFGSGKYAPLNFKANEQLADELGIPEEDRILDPHGRVIGFRDQTRKYRGYQDANVHSNGKLQRLFKSPVEDLRHYAGGAYVNTRNALLRTALEKSNPGEVANEGLGFEKDGTPFHQAGGAQLPFYASRYVDQYLKNFREAWQPSSAVGQKIEHGIKIVGANTKKALFMGSPFHEVHIAENVTGASLLGGEPGIIGRGVMNEVKGAGGISKGSYFDLVSHYRQDGTLQFARNIGLKLESDGALGRFIDVYALALAKGLKNGGIDAGSQEAVDIGRVYNHLLGRENAAVEGVNPTLERMTSYFALAPHYLRTQLKLVYEAMAPKKLGGAGYDSFVSLKHPGGAARAAVLGPRAFGALFAVTASAILMHNFPTWQDVVNEAGLNPNNPNPNVNIKSRNSKGESQVMNLPTDPLGLGVGLVTDPQHFAISRESPVLSFLSKLVTNKNWNGNPLADPNQPNYAVNLVKNAAANSFIPIGLQNFTNLQNNPNNPNVEQGIAQELGGRLKTNPNDPQVEANTKYFNAFNQVSNTLKANGEYGQYWAEQFNALHPANTTDAAGNKYPVPYQPLSSEAKYNAYTTVDSSGAQHLSPVFYADQKLAAMTPGYPSEPLYKLGGNGVDVSGNAAPKALVAMQYQHAQDPAAKTVIMNANGGQNGWLSNYETQVGDYSQNYQANLTGYFKSLGWSDKAVNDYWSKHPSTPDPVASPTFDAPTTNLINQYYQLSASGDSTAASQFFTKNAGVLGNAFDIMAQHANALREAKGELQLQGYPAESAHVAAVLNSMPSGADSASKQTRSDLINNNPDVNQYLADIALYEALDKGAQFRYQNPADMSATEGGNIMGAGNTGQTFLKDVRSMGMYDIGYDPNNPAGSQYDFMQNGGLGNGFGASGSSKSDPLVALPPRPKTRKVRIARAPKAKRIAVKKAHLKTGTKVATGAMHPIGFAKSKSATVSIKT